MNNSTPTTAAQLRLKSDALALQKQLAGHLRPLSEEQRTDFMRGVKLRVQDHSEALTTFDAQGYAAVLTPYSDIESKTTEWLWDQWLPLGALSLMVGTEGLGKTAFGLWLAAQLTRGTLPGIYYGTPVTVALATPEDDAGATIKNRLEAAGADMTRVLDLTVKKDQFSRGLSLPEDTDMIVQALVQADVRFVFADPIASLLNPSANSWKDTDIRDALEPIIAACSEHGITLLGSLHTNKTQSTDPRQRGMGSAGWRQLCRAQILFGLDPEDPEGSEGYSRCIALTKHNLGRPQKTWRAQLVAATVDVQGKAQESVKLALGDQCEVKAAAMLAHEQGHEDAGKSKEDQATRWLLGMLDDGPKAVALLKQASEEAGHSWRNVERAKKDLGATAFQPKGVRGWSWQMPTGALAIA